VDPFDEALVAAFPQIREIVLERQMRWERCGNGLSG
jgi:hypothetical protein